MPRRRSRRRSRVSSRLARAISPQILTMDQSSSQAAGLHPLPEADRACRTDQRHDHPRLINAVRTRTRDWGGPAIEPRHSLAPRLFDEGYDFDFFQAVRAAPASGNWARPNLVRSHHQSR